MTLLVALAVPIAALAQVERTVTDGPTSTVETNQTRAITDSPVSITNVNNISTNSAWICFKNTQEPLVGDYTGRYSICYKTENTGWSVEDIFTVQYNGGTPYCNFANVCTITPFTLYTVKIRCYKNNDYCEWSNEYTFATKCPATATPYSIDFNGLSALPQYWRVNASAGNGYTVANDQLSVSTTSGNPLDAYVILPYFENLATLQLSFNAARTAGSCNEMQVGIMTDPFNANTFSLLQTLTLSEATTTYGSSLLEASAQHGHIAIKLNDATEEQHSVWFDDFAVTRLQALDNLAVDVTNNSATLSWTTIAPSVQIQYRVADGTWSASITPEGNPYTITGLTESTNYEARICANFTSFNSDWESFGTFKTLMQEAVVMNAENASYDEDFESGNGNWMFIDGGGEVNRWRRFSYFTMSYGNLGYGLRVTYSADNSATTQWEYRTGYSYSSGNNSGFMGTPATSYAVKTFTLSAGHYEFGYDYAVKGRANDDYMRVVLVPAETVFEAGVLPEGFDYNNTPNDWFALDGGHQLVGNANNYYDWNAQSPITLDVYPGGTYEPGNYMIVVLWKNDGSLRFDLAQNPPGAIDNVSVTWSPLVTPPDMNTLVAAPTDTQATLTWDVPTCTLTPTGYEVEYATDASFTDALTASTNTNSVTLTGLAANTNYYVQIRSTYTTNGTTLYSDWSDARAFTTAMPIPTELTLVSQTTSWANVMWTPVALTLPEGQSINYSYQLTTDVNDWGEANEGLGNESWAENLAPATYHFRVRTAIYDSNANELVDFSDWSEPIQFTIAPWSEPVSVFPLTYSFDEWSSRFVDGITLDGNLAALEMANYNELPTPDGGENEYSLSFCSSLNTTACVVLPPLNPSTSDAMVSFWWYHHSGHENFLNTSTNDGVEVETSTDGINWTTASYGVVPRYDANFTGWKKYEFVFPATTNPTYLRLRFVGTTGNFLYCYLDDLTVRTFKSEQPYIQYVGCDANTATITLYDYAYENGYHSSAFEVQYREWRDPSETQNEWTTYPQFTNEAPYAFERTLTVEGLQPATCYEFRARARVSYNGNDFDWSNCCEPVRQWTDCGTYTITPSYSYTEDFEELFNGTDCWTVDEGWTMQQSGGHNGSDYCAYVPAGASNRVLTSPAITFEGCDNVIIRFWAKGQGRVAVLYGEDFGTTKLFNVLPVTDDWTMIELPLCYYMDKTPIKISFRSTISKAWYVDDISIIANAYGKIFDGEGRNIAFWSGIHWYPSGDPTENDDVMIMGNAYAGNNYVARTINFGVSIGKLVVYNSNGRMTATTINATRENTVQVQNGGILNVTTLNPGEANSVVVKDGGTLYAGTITGTSDEVDNTVVVEDGGQLWLDNPAYVTIKKNIESYTEIEANNNVNKGGYYLISSPLNTNYFNPAMADACTQVTEGGETVWTYDLYSFNYTYDEEWRNYRLAPFNMSRGKGYLYANRDGVELSFAGPVAANNTSYPVNTDYSQGGHYDFNGWTLVGNPYPCNTYISGSVSDMSFYRMNPSGSGFIAATGTVAPMEGIFVYTEMSGQAVYFDRNEPTQGNQRLSLNLKQGNVLVDNAIIRFGEGGELPKFSFSDNTSKVYFPMKDKDFAVMHSQPVGELPLNFEAAEDGTFTLSFDNAAEGLMYCHLIDNLTGADVDLLAGASTGSATYTFTAKTTDYASRFRVVFAATGAGGEACEPSFAFENNGNWIILNEGRATLQVIDLNGRILSSEQIEGCAETRINAAAGVYMLRLVNGENVKVQKVVVR